jgi:hypothetical protein
VFSLSLNGDAAEAAAPQAQQKTPLPLQERQRQLRSVSQVVGNRVATMWNDDA